MRKLNVALVGTGFAGKVHAIAMATMPAFFWPPPAVAVRKVVVDVTDELARTARDRFGFEGYATSWQDVIARPDIDIIDICTPNNTHAEIAIAAAKAGKHVLCEKPMAVSSAEAKQMVDAARAAGIVNMVGLNYRHTPAVVMAAKIIAEGRIGDVLSYRGSFLQDWSADPGTPLSWRFQKKFGGGALGDIGAHILDTTLFLLGDIVAVNAVARTLVPERPVQSGAYDKMGAADKTAGGPKDRVDVDDDVMALVRFKSGVIGTIEASRNTYGHSCRLGFEIYGSAGSIIFDYQRLGELQVMYASDPPDSRGFRTVLIGPDHPFGENFWPIPSIGIGYSDIKAIEMFKLVTAIAEGTPAAPSFYDGYRLARISDGMLEFEPDTGLGQNGGLGRPPAEARLKERPVACAQEFLLRGSRGRARLSSVARPNARPTQRRDKGGWDEPDNVQRDERQHRHGIGRWPSGADAVCRRRAAGTVCARRS